MYVCMTIRTSVSSSSTSENKRSSFLHTVVDYYLQGYVTHRQMSPSVLSCAQLCLRNRPLCHSLNYDKEGTKICELNDEGIDITKTGVSSLVPKFGFIFGQPLNLTVSNKQEIVNHEWNSEVLLRAKEWYKLISNRCALLSLLYCIISAVFCLTFDYILITSQTGTKERTIETRVHIFPNSFKQGSNCGKSISVQSHLSSNVLAFMDNQKYMYM